MEILASNLGQGIDYPELDFSEFFSPSRKISRRYLKLGHGRFLPHGFLFIVLCPAVIKSYDASIYVV
jgi:hypothetical protein